MTKEDKAYADELRNKAISDYERLNLAINELEQCEVWNGSHGQIVAPKGTFKKIYEEERGEDE